jgi:hypothetical protein
MGIGDEEALGEGEVLFGVLCWDVAGPHCCESLEVVRVLLDKVAASRARELSGCTDGVCPSGEPKSDPGESARLGFVDDGMVELLEVDEELELVGERGVAWKNGIVMWMLDDMTVSWNRSDAMRRRTESRTVGKNAATLRSRREMGRTSTRLGTSFFSSLLSGLDL